jgi:thiol:disulfide interchange protein DsbC
MKRVIYSFVVSCWLLLSPAFAQQAEPIEDPETFNESIKGGLESKGQITGMQEMPISKLMFVEAEQGTFLISSDGRFVIEGTIKDVWHRKTIKSAADVKQTQRTPISNIGFKPEEQLAYFTVGNPELPRQGVAFVDPTSLYTTQFLEQLEANQDEVNWTVVLLPLVGGTNAINRSVHLHCARDRDQAKLDFIHGTDVSFSDMTEGCTDEKVLLGMMLTDVYRIENLPHLIREDGLVSSGLPVDFESWFTQP